MKTKYVPLLVVSAGEESIRPALSQIKCEGNIYKSTDSFTATIIEEKEQRKFPENIEKFFDTKNTFEMCSIDTLLNVAEKSKFFFKKDGLVTFGNEFYITDKSKLSGPFQVNYLNHTNIRISVDATYLYRFLKEIKKVAKSDEIKVTCDDKRLIFEYTDENVIIKHLIMGVNV